MKIYIGHALSVLIVLVACGRGGTHRLTSKYVDCRNNTHPS